MEKRAMSNYQPHKWIVIKIVSPEKDTVYKVFGSWSGGYLDGDSWRLNSGITSVKVRGDILEFYGSSGSCYGCHKDSYGTNVYTAGILAAIVENGTGAGWGITVLDIDTDWSNIEYEQITR
jgi:hypothetical protein